MSSLVHNVYLSTGHRDTVKYPSASSFTIDLPQPMTNIHSIRVRSYKFNPECVINANNQNMAITANSGQLIGNVQIPVGDYNQSITDIIGVINTYLGAYDVAFAIDPTTQLVQLTFSGPFVTDYFAIAYCPLLKLLGFNNGIYMYRPASSPGSIPSTSLAYNNVACALRPYTTVNDTDMVLRIIGLEAISSVEPTSNRATAILVSTRTPLTTSMGFLQQELPYPLLQVQHRIQTLRISIWNNNGYLYDLSQSDASFILEFHCHRQ